MKNIIFLETKHIRHSLAFQFNNSSLELKLVLAEENKVKIRVVRDFNEFDQLADPWDDIVEKSSNNPFLLSEFIKQALEHVPKDWTPFVLIISKGKTIIGIAPLRIRFSFANRKVVFLKPYYCSDFIFDEKHRELCIKLTFEFIFKKLSCNHIQLVFPHDSPNFIILERYCEKNKIHLQTYFEKGRRVVPVCSTWSKFFESRPRTFRKNMRRLKRNLSKSGSWRLLCVKGSKQTDISKKIFNIEKKSWKEQWRSQTGARDFGLQIILKSLQNLSSRVQNLKWRTWFLEFEGKTIAYVLGMKYKDIAVLAKTSYDYKFRNLSPGMLTQLFSVQQLFDEKQTKLMDFLSDLHYMRLWTNTCFPRIGTVISKGIVTTFLLILKQKLIFCVRSSPLLMKQVDKRLSSGSFANMFNPFLKRFI